ncbi:hypothetical protein GCM10027445_09950 [Amycolatopsis endophytica]|uniref:DoxX family protein n=1 Tax=Amycolatopsis endophytica TaxID=860233 RepID=A0A853AXB9_9PSEU|nr:DoxX family protein [Amycolatopsis endophytica]NYI87231.1 hypothetical protein [Amycolatopsis endophytica]
MQTVSLVVTVVTIVLNAGIAAADFARAPFVLANSTAVEVPHSWIPMLASLKAAGSAGLLLGLLGAEWLGVAAAAGLVLFYLGAVAAHVRARRLSTTGPAAVLLALAVACLVLGLR